MAITHDEVRAMAERYAEAWCSHSLDAIVAFFEETGQTQVNGGDPIVGHAEILETVKGFLDAFPDLVIRIDDVRSSGNHAIFCWTLEGTNTGPGGSGHFVKINGWEEWDLSESVRLRAVKGWFDPIEYERQVSEGFSK